MEAPPFPTAEVAAETMEAPPEVIVSKTPPAPLVAVWKAPPAPEVTVSKAPTAPEVAVSKAPPTAEVAWSKMDPTGLSVERQVMFPGERDCKSSWWIAVCSQAKKGKKDIR